MESRRIVKSRVSVPKPTVWIVILSHGSIKIAPESSSEEEKVVAMGNEVLLEKIPQRYNLEYEATCSCPSVITCDQQQTDTMLSYSEAWKEKDVTHSRVL